MPTVLAQIDWNSLLHSDTLPMLIVFGSGTIIGLTVIIAIQWRKAQQTSYEAALKQQMIERGFTAEEISTVINASIESKQAAKGVRVPQARSEGCCPID